MFYFKTIVFTFGVFFANLCYCQKEELRKVDNELTQIFHSLNESDLTSHDSISKLFSNKLLNFLSLQYSFDNSLDSLSKYISVIASQDNKIKFYSWDEQYKSPWHTFNCYAQFIASDGRIIVQSISSDSNEVDFTDGDIYEVCDIKIDTTKYYLTFAWGTHAGGNQFQIIQIFSIVSDKLMKCQTCLNNQSDIIIEYPRISKLKLSYDSEKKEISYKEFKPYEDDPFYYETGEIVKLRLLNGMFEME